MDTLGWFIGMQFPSYSFVSSTVQADSAHSASGSTSRSLFVLLMLAALIYAFLAGFYTLTSFDLGWQLATGRWIAQHHHIPSTDVFSYTAPEQPWIYPIASGLIFYALFLVGGYSLLTWLGAVACAGTVALLLRRGSPVSGAIAILAIPVIAMRTSPRAEMFTVVLFAAFLSILWERLEGGKGKLWLLPLLMVAWVNLHLGFLSGIALLIAYAVLELLRMLQERSRQAAALRLREALPWLFASFLATLVNPWGWAIFKALERQEGIMGLHSHQITEWVSAPLTRATLLSAFSLRKPDGSFYLLAAIAIVAVAVAVAQKQGAAAILVSGAAWLGVRHLRFQALFACVVIVVAGPPLASALSAATTRISDKKLRSILASGAAALLLMLAVLRTAELVTNRYYFSASGERRSFGTGLSWWFPEQAAEFIQRENLPARIFNSYDEGGFVSWALGPKYQDYIDGRAVPFGQQLFDREGELMQAAPDGPEWKREADRYDIKTIVVPLGRYDGLELFRSLPQFCNSETWRPVYLDETSAVFVRRTRETEALIARTHLDCATAPLPRARSSGSNQKFNQWANAAAVLYTLGRNQEAFGAATHALSIFPESSISRLIRARVLLTMGRTAEAETEFLEAADLDDNSAIWFSLARMYQLQGRLPEAIHAVEKMAEISPRPFSALLTLGHLYLEAHRPKDALDALARARKVLPDDPDVAVDGPTLADLAHSSALARRDLGELTRAVSDQEEAVRLAPDDSHGWLQLADLYELQGRVDDARIARQRAASASEPQSKR